MNMLDNWLKTLFVGVAPQINDDFCPTGRITSGLKSAITKDIEYIISENKGHYKFGKIGFAPTRADQDDYRSASYAEMYLFYETTSKDFVSILEEYYSTKYHLEKRCDNIHTHSAGKMRSVHGYYYLYLVI